LLTIHVQKKNAKDNKTSAAFSPHETVRKTLCIANASEQRLG